MHEPESATNQPRAPKLLVNFLWRRIGCDIEVLGLMAKEQISDTATHHISGKACLLQPLYNVSRCRADVLWFDGQQLICGRNNE